MQTKTKETAVMVPRPTDSHAVRGLPRSLLVRVTGRLSINVCIYLCSKAVEIRTNLRFNARFFHRQFAQGATGQYLRPYGGALVSTHRWKRRRHVEDGSLASLKSGPKQINADHQDLALAA